ncbi:YihY/virulence factor BrkB family protein [Sphaerisporangium sp. TRM90804]|uniref:YihY/virulence factor BrkB family protein n=1 Tax=Sphaerisporangium sp. TRM90804 TaxID=3031113 RepID=UPI002449972E|nr:YihY/virulence factor BrkB family protein [Sphaerisporangium sp. TRM90804]MDH2424212.1 YihY/virulence factor BrkB family protein [Sphaerisporangium sp. TRM90804]
MVRIPVDAVTSADTRAALPRRRTRIRRRLVRKARAGASVASAGLSAVRGSSVWAWVGRSPLWAVVRATAVAGFTYRVTGLAGEAAFFALLSLPPFVLGLIGLLGHLTPVVGPGTVAESRAWVLDQSHLLFSGDTVDRVVKPLLDDVLKGGQVSLISVGFLLALWSGSRALFVYVDLISISYGLGETRGIIRTRIMSFGLYLAALLLGLIVMPILVLGPTMLSGALSRYGGLVDVLYWPVLVAGSVLVLTLLYHVSVPVRTRWWRELPGALLALVIWIACAAVLRAVLAAWFTPLSVYGSLAAPIAVLLWLYITALAVLIGATLNAEVDRLWPAGRSESEPGSAIV